MAMIWRRPFGYQPGLGTAVNSSGPAPSSGTVPMTPAVLQPTDGTPMLGAEGVPSVQSGGVIPPAARPNGLQAFKKGGVVKKTGPALVHKGERVLSKSQNRRFTKGKLTTAKRASLASSKFGLPRSRKYPMPDRSHAANAKARATQQYNKGNLSGSAKAMIDAKANGLLGRPATAVAKLNRV